MLLHIRAAPCRRPHLTRPLEPGRCGVEPGAFAEAAPGVQELSETHAHYQKLLDDDGGSSYSEDDGGSYEPPVASASDGGCGPQQDRGGAAGRAPHTVGQAAVLAGHGSSGSGGAVATGEGSLGAGRSMQRAPSLAGMRSLSVKGARGGLGRQASVGRAQSRQAAAMAAEVTAATERAQYEFMPMHVAMTCLHACGAFRFAVVQATADAAHSMQRKQREGLCSPSMPCMMGGAAGGVSGVSHDSS